MIEKMELNIALKLIACYEKFIEKVKDLSEKYTE